MSSPLPHRFAIFSLPIQFIGLLTRKPSRLHSVSQRTHMHGAMATSSGTLTPLSTRTHMHEYVVYEV